jgi:hypothetical protein
MRWTDALNVGLVQAPPSNNENLSAPAQDRQRRTDAESARSRCRSRFRTTAVAAPMTTPRQTGAVSDRTVAVAAPILTPPQTATVLGVRRAAAVPLTAPAPSPPPFPRPARRRTDAATAPHRPFPSQHRARSRFRPTLVVSMSSIAGKCVIRTIMGIHSHEKAGLVNSNLRLFVSSVVVAMWLAPNCPSQEKKFAALRLPGNGVSDPAGKTGFFPNTIGGIDALDLATGKLLWSSKDANRPLVATDNRLFVQKGAAVQILDTVEKGKLVLEAKPLSFPGWVSVDVAYGRTFRSSARVEGRSLWLSWEAGAFYAGGARPTPEIEKAERKEGAGVERVDLDNGKIESLDAEKIAAGKFLPMPVETVNPKIGALTLQVQDNPAKKSKSPFEKRRTLQAVNEAKEVVWQHDIAAPIFLPPRP